MATHKPRNWFHRFVIALCVLPLILFAWGLWPMSQPIVDESGRDMTVQEAPNMALSGAYPTSAKNIRYANSCVGMGGRFHAYRFSAPVAVLKVFANAEFAKHWDHPAVSVTPNAPPPFDADELARLGHTFGLELDWMLPQNNAIGSVYRSADGQDSHRPTIFVDETNAVLYFLMTD